MKNYKPGLLLAALIMIIGGNVANASNYPDDKYGGVDDLRSGSLPKDIVIAEERVVVEQEPAAREIETENVLRVAEQMPEYPGGNAALFKAIADNMVYPASALDEHIQGHVVVRFVVQKDGTIGKVVVERGVDPDLDKEAVRIVKKLGKFYPGRNNGQPVAVWYMLPIRFKLPAM